MRMRLLSGQIGRIALVGLAVVVIWLGILAHLREQSQQVLQQATGDTQNLARAFAENTEHTFDAIDQTLLFVRELYQRDPQHFDLGEWARHRQFVSGATFQISAVDRDGILIASNLGPVTERVDLSDREHVRVQRLSTDDRIYISAPVVGRVSRKLSLNVTRKLLDAAGHYAGTVIVSVDPYYLSRFHETLELGDGVMLLVGDDNIVRARAPALPGTIGRTLDEAARGEFDQGRPAGTFVSRSPVDDVTRLISYRRLSDYPLTVAVGLDLAEVYAPYRRERTRYLLIGGALTLLAVLAGALLILQRDRLVQSQQALTATLENIGQGILMADARDRIAVINRRVIELLELPDPLVRRATTLREISQHLLRSGEYGPPEQIEPAFRRYIETGEQTAAATIYQRVRPNGTVLEVRSQRLPEGGVVRTFTDISDASRQRAGARRRARRGRGGRARAQRIPRGDEPRNPHADERHHRHGRAAAGHAPRREQRGYVAHHPRQRRAPAAADQRHPRLLAARRGRGSNSRRPRSTCASWSQARVDAVRLASAARRGSSCRSRSRPTCPPRSRGDAAAAAPGAAQPRRQRASSSPQPAACGSTSARLGASPGAVRCRLRGQPTPASAFRRTRWRGCSTSSPRSTARSRAGSAAAGSGSRSAGSWWSDGRRDRGRQHARRRQHVPLRPVAAQRRPGRASGPGAPPEAPPEVPAVVAPPPEPPPASLEDTPDPWLPPTGPLRVLVAEDNATNRLVVTRMLERLGHRVDAVGERPRRGGGGGVRRYDLVLMDVMMPEMDGLTATAAIRALPGDVARTPILGLTANAMRTDEEAALAAGMDHFATKPISAARLQRAIALALGCRDAPA